MVKTFGKKPVDVYLKLVDKEVKPILLYAYQCWGDLLH